MEMICQAVCNVLCFVPAWFGGFLPSVLSGVSEMKPIGNLNGEELLSGGFWWISSLLVSQKVPETIKGYPVSIRFRYPAVSACSHIINKWQNWQPSMPMTACFTDGVRSSFSPHTFFCPSIWYKFSFVTSAQKSQSSADFFFVLLSSNSNLAFMFLRLTLALYLRTTPLRQCHCLPFYIVLFDTSGTGSQVMLIICSTVSPT